MSAVPTLGCLEGHQPSHREFRASMSRFFFVFFLKNILLSSVLSLHSYWHLLERDNSVINSGERGTQDTECQNRLCQRGGRTEWEGSWKVQAKKLWIEVIKHTGAEIEYEQEIRKKGLSGKGGVGWIIWKTAQNTEQETKQPCRA